MLRSICERFNVGRSTSLYITRLVVKTLVELAPMIIKWPTSERVNEIWAGGFENMSGFPKVIEAIDGTHINIPAPKNNPECYVNRKVTIPSTCRYIYYIIFQMLSIKFSIKFIFCFSFCSVLI